jgi:hypothetical protein
MHNRPENGHNTRIALCAHSTYTHILILKSDINLILPHSPFQILFFWLMLQQIYHTCNTSSSNSEVATSWTALYLLRLSPRASTNCILMTVASVTSDWQSVDSSLWCCMLGTVHCSEIFHSPSEQFSPRDSQSETVTENELQIMKCAIYAWLFCVKTINDK